MAQSTFSPMQFVHKAAMGLSVAFLLAPMAISVPSQAQTARTAQPQRTQRLSQPPRTTTPQPTPVIRTTGSGGGTSPVANAGSCSGVSDCNNFIAICIGGGGTYVPGTHNGQGQPTSGTCDVD
ncbi:MAG: hypothetical protein ABG776_03910 [Cyanobacteria bacterium J06555_13]